MLRNKRLETYREKKKTGPIQLPWGTPQFRLKSSEVLSPTNIERNESNQFKAVPATPKPVSKYSEEWNVQWYQKRHLGPKVREVSLPYCPYS